jgi:hypothetical protein
VLFAESVLTKRTHLAGELVWFERFAAALNGFVRAHGDSDGQEEKPASIPTNLFPPSVLRIAAHYREFTAKYPQLIGGTRAKIFVVRVKAWCNFRSLQQY